MKGLVPIIQEMVMTGGITVTGIKGIAGTVEIVVMTITGMSAMEGMTMMMTGMTVMVITTRDTIMAETIMADIARIMEDIVRAVMAMVITRR
jgi:hypothetical protein